MNNIDTSQIVDPSIGQPFTGPSLAFLQNATSDMIQALAQTFIGNSYNSAVPYALIGLTFTGVVTLPTSVTGGYILWNNEVFQCPGHGGAFSVGPQFSISVTNPAPDPLTFSDNNPRDVHNVRRIVLNDTATVGLFTLAQLVYLSPNFIIQSWTNASLLNSWASSSTPKFRIVQDRVEMTGVLTNATLTNATLSMFRFPANMRPIIDTYVSVVALNNGVAYTRDVFITASTGDFALDTTGFSNVTTTVYLNGRGFVTT